MCQFGAFESEILSLRYSDTCNTTAIMDVSAISDFRVSTLVYSAEKYNDSREPQHLKRNENTEGEAIEFRLELGFKYQTPE